MNINLSICSHRVLGKNCYSVDISGKCVSSDIFSFHGDNIKKNILQTVHKGLRDVRRFVTHNSVIVIEIQNRHLAQWLDGETESSGYEEELGNIFELLESIDGRYMIVFEKNPRAKKLLGKKKEMNLVGVDFIESM